MIQKMSVVMENEMTQLSVMLGKKKGAHAKVNKGRGWGNEEQNVPLIFFYPLVRGT